MFQRLLNFFFNSQNIILGDLVFVFWCLFVCFNYHGSPIAHIIYSPDFRLASYIPGEWQSFKSHDPNSLGKIIL